MIAIYADDSAGTNDPEVYSGHDRKIPGGVFVALFSRLATALIPQKRLARVARLSIRILMVALTLIWTANHSRAGLGWTLAQFKQEYGKPALDQDQIAGRTGYVFTEQDYIIAIFLRDTQVSRILYICRGGSVLGWERARALLKANAPDANWDDASRNEADNSYRVNGTKDGVEGYFASLTNDGKMLAIWTKEDDEAGRTKPRPDTPPVSSVVASNEKSTGKVTSGQIPSIDGESTHEINHPDVPAKATSSSSAHRPASAHALRTKSAEVKPRSSLSRRENFNVAHFDAKARTTGFQHDGGHAPVPAATPSLMKAGTSLYNSDYTQPFKNSKKASGP